jgi:hypothetical protein
MPWTWSPDSEAVLELDSVFGSTSWTKMSHGLEDGTSTPHVVRGFDDKAKFGNLLIQGEAVAFHRR